MKDHKDIFEKFSEPTRSVLLSAQKIAENMGGGVDSEHLLIALAVTPGTLAYEILKEYMVSVDQIRLILSLRDIRPRVTKGLSIDAKKILKNAYRFAADYSHINVDPEHLLLAIVSDPSLLAYQIIAQIGVSPEHLRRQILNVFEDLSDMNKIGDEFEGPPPLPEEELVTAGGLKTKVSTPALDYFALDLTEKARQGKVDPLIGRQNELKRAIQILARRTKNNPVFIGEPGVGKTAIVEGLAQKIIQSDVPESLKNKRILSLDLSLLVAGTMYRGQFEDRIKKVLEEIVKSKDVVLFIDELHTVVGAGAAEGSMDAANILKPALAKGEIRLIGATTVDEYRKYIEKDAALERRLQAIQVSEPTPEETAEILKGLRGEYEKHHHVTITDEALKAAAFLTSRYVSDRYLPDKAIDVIDEAASALKIASESTRKGGEIPELEENIKKVNLLKLQKISEEKFEEAAKLRDEELTLHLRLKRAQTNKRTKNQIARPLISEEEVAEIVSAWTGVPLGKIVKSEKEKLLTLEETLKTYVIGQEEAIKFLSQAIRRSKSGIANPNRPIGSFIFLGPTGVGKTELAKVLAREVYGKEEYLIKIDMSEFMERHNVSRLVGAPPGYVGYEEAGKLTEAVRRQPYSVVLFDEIEKAHPEIFNILLQILEDGYLTDAKGRKINFRNTIIIMTSNIGVKELTQGAKIGFETEKKGKAIDYEILKEKVLEDLRRQFNPEFLNRLDKIIVFNPLDKKAIEKIVEIEIEKLIKKTLLEGINLKVTPTAIKLLTEKSFNPEYGARPVRRTITDLVEDLLSTEILGEKFKKGETIRVKTKGGKIALTK